MSWEDSAPIERSCPCGIGQYVVIGRSDDWNRYEERWEMHCPSCNEKYGLYTSNDNCKGMVFWLPNLLLKELSVAVKELEQAKKAMSVYATVHYLEPWNTHFSGKAKKAIWRELTEDGRHYPSLSTFYLHVRESSLERQLARYFDYRELPTVVRVLRLSVSELHSNVKQVRELERMLEEKYSHARQQSFV